MQEFVEKLKSIGMTEKEAKVYAVLFELKVATAREILSTTSARSREDKVYEALANLEEKGFVGTAEEAGPSRFFIHDINKTFNRLRQENLERLNDVEQYLHSRITFQHNRPLLSHTLQNTWAIDSHLRMMFNRCKKEIVMICRDTAYVKKTYLEPEKSPEKDRPLFNRPGRHRSGYVSYTVLHTSARDEGVHGCAKYQRIWNRA